jgi:hypothetical protein
MTDIAYIVAIFLGIACLYCQGRLLYGCIPGDASEWFVLLVMLAFWTYFRQSLQSACTTRKADTVAVFTAMLAVFTLVVIDTEQRWEKYHDNTVLLLVYTLRL